MIENRFYNKERRTMAHVPVVTSTDNSGPKKRWRHGQGKQVGKTQFRASLCQRPPPPRTMLKKKSCF